MRDRGTVEQRFEAARDNAERFFMKGREPPRDRPFRATICGSRPLVVNLCNAP